MLRLEMGRRIGASGMTERLSAWGYSSIITLDDKTHTWESGTAWLGRSLFSPSAMTDRMGSFMLILLSKLLGNVLRTFDFLKSGDLLDSQARNSAITFGDCYNSGHKYRLIAQSCV